MADRGWRPGGTDEPSPYTVEGRIAILGRIVHAAKRDTGRRGRAARALLAIMLFLVALTALAWIVALF